MEQAQDIYNFINEIERVKQIIAKLMADPKKKGLTERIIALHSNLLTAMIDTIDQNGSFIFNFTNKMKGKQPAAMNFSVINDFSDQEYKVLADAVVNALTAMGEHHLQLKAEKDKEKQEKIDQQTVAVNIEKNEDGSCNINFG